MQVTLDLPAAIWVDDYHDFSFIEDILNDISTQPIKIKEVGFRQEYVGIMYTGKLPSRKEIKELVHETFLLSHPDELDDIEWVWNSK